MLKFEIVGFLYGFCAALTVIGVLMGRSRRRRLPPPLPEVRPRAMDLAGVATIFLIYGGLFFAGGAAATERVIELTPVGMVVSMVAQTMVMGVALAFVLPRMDASRFFGLRWPQWPWIFAIAPAVVAITWVLAGVLYAAGYFEWIEGVLGESSVQEAVVVLQESRDPVLLALMTFAVVVVAPLVEEVLFRGYLYTVLKEFTGRAFGLGMSAAIFAVAHNEVGVLPVLFALGLMLAWVYERTGSIWAPIGVHAAFNLMTVVVQFGARLSGAGVNA